MRALWAERVPPHRRIDADGRPTLENIREQIRRGAGGPLGLLAAVERESSDVVGYCGLVESDHGGVGEPEIAFELLRRVHGRGYATEAATAVIGWAREAEYQRIWGTVWDWNIPSRRVLEKLGFVETGVESLVPGRGANLITCLPLHLHSGA